MKKYNAMQIEKWTLYENQNKINNSPLYLQKNYDQNCTWYLVEQQAYENMDVSKGFDTLNCGICVAKFSIASFSQDATAFLGCKNNHKLDGFLQLDIF